MEFRFSSSLLPESQCAWIFVNAYWHSGFTSHDWIEQFHIKEQIPLCKSPLTSASSRRGGELSEIQRLDASLLNSVSRTIPDHDQGEV